MNGRRGDWVRRTLRAYSASAAITLGALNAGARPLGSHETLAFERVYDATLENGLDPREIVARRIIITLPLEEVMPASDRTPFVPN